jgi:hypothetical protein
MGSPVVMPTDEHPRETTIDPGPDKASGEVDPKAAGKKTGPPGGDDVDNDAVERGRDRLDRVEAGH